MAASTTQQQHRHVGFSRHQLQAAGCDHRYLACLCDDRRRRPIAHRILDHGEQGRVVKWLSINDI